VYIWNQKKAFGVIYPEFLQMAYRIGELGIQAWLGLLYRSKSSRSVSEEVICQGKDG
jgi:hypothetical protein